MYHQLQCLPLNPEAQANSLAQYCIMAFRREISLGRGHQKEQICAGDTLISQGVHQMVEKIIKAGYGQKDSDLGTQSV